MANRITIFTCVIFALAGLEIRQNSDSLAVVFLLDQSDSYPASLREDALSWILTAVENMPPDDQAGLIVFGGDALVEQAVSPEKAWGAVSSAPFTQETDLAEAIQLAQALFPPGSAKMIILFGDGIQTTGSVVDAARQARSAGIDLLWADQEVLSPAEVALLTVRSPIQVIQGEQFDLAFSVQASTNTRTRVRVFGNGEILAERDLDIYRGEQSYKLPLVSGPPGFTRYQVQIEPELDTFFQNNQLDSITQVSGPPTILIISPSAGDGQLSEGALRQEEYSNLSRALQAAGYEIKVVRPSGFPTALEDLAGYAAAILVNVPAGDLSPGQMNTMQAYVRDLGGGLVVIGGPDSFGVGGYYQTTLEEILPVEMRITNDSQKPPVSIIYIIDRSGSMAGESGGVSKILLAQEAVIRSVQLMFPEDQVGIIAFDDTPEWIVPLTRLDDLNTVIRPVGSIRAGGGTDILSGLEAAASILPEAASPIKHIVLLTDGGSDPAGIPELVKDLRENHTISLSTIGVGDDAASFLPLLAELGGGRFHYTPDPAAIPSIFTQETSLVTRAYLIEGQIQPEFGVSSPILSGLTALPPLHGYVATRPKIAATNIIFSPQGDPILATWQYGLGKAAAFTADATNRWGKEWITWAGFSGFWSQVVGFVSLETTRSNLNTTIENQGEQAIILVEGYNNEGELLNNYQIIAHIVYPDQQTVALSLTQVAPGLYEGTFTPDQQGAFLININGEPPDQEPGGFSETIGWVQAYEKEYQIWPDPVRSPADLLEQTRIFKKSKSQEDYFRHDLPGPLRVIPIWQALLGIAAALLPFDIGIRRLTIDRKDLQGAWAAVTGRILNKSIHTEETLLPEPRIQGKYNARKRVQGKSEKIGGQEESSNQLVETESTNRPTSPPSRTIPSDTDFEETSSVEEQSPQEKNLAATLLERRKGRKKKN
jgi:uncharacterized membrane protein